MSGLVHDPVHQASIHIRHKHRILVGSQNFFGSKFLSGIASSLGKANGVYTSVERGDGFILVIRIATDDQVELVPRSFS